MEYAVECDDGTRLWVRDQGSGPVVLLVHGFPLDGSLWDAQRAALAERYRVITVDLRGFGRSSINQDLVTMAQYADDLAEVLQKLAISDPVFFGGLSMGGYIAWEFWQRHRQRVRGMMLVNTRSGADSREMARGREMTADRVLEEGTEEFAEGMLQKLFSPATVERAPEVIEPWRSIVPSQSPRAVAAALRGMAQRASFNSRLPEVQVPALVIAGRDDKITPPEEMQQMAARMPRTQMVVLDQAGHLTPIEKPAEVTRAMLDFLEPLCS
jgi:pimeloyl-ACP methyl ester carboxylesterase